MKNKSKEYPVAIDDLLIEFDEMDYCPMNLSGGDPVKEAITWSGRRRYEPGLVDEKSAIERRAIEEFAGKLKNVIHERDYVQGYAEIGLIEEIDELLKEYKNEQES